MTSNSYKFNQNQSRKSKKIWSWILVLVILICSYLGIFHSHQYYGFDIVLWIAIIGVLAVSGLHLIWFGDRTWQKLRSFLFVLLVGGPISILVIIFHNVYINKQLTGHELYVHAVVTDVYVKHNKHSQTAYAVFTYQAKGRTWTQNMVNTDNSLVIGDTLKLVCSELDPEIILLKKD